MATCILKMKVPMPKPDQPKVRCSPVKEKLEENSEATNAISSSNQSYWKQNRSSPVHVEMMNSDLQFDHDYSETAKIEKQAKDEKPLAKKKPKYTSKSYGKKVSKIREDEIPNYDTNNYPVLSGASKGPVSCLELELNAKAHSKSKEKMARIIDSVAIEEGKYFSRPIKNVIDVERFMSFYMGLVVGNKHPAYAPGEPGFVLFRASTIRYILTQIAKFNPDGESEARLFLEDVMHTSDEEYPHKISQYMETYTLDPQGYFFPDEMDHKHRLDADQFTYLKQLIDLVSINRSDLAKGVGADFAAGMMEGLDFGGIVSSDLWNNVNNLCKSLTNVDVKTLMSVSFIAAVLLRILNEGVTKKVLAEIAIGGFVLFSFAKQRTIGEKLRTFFSNMQPEEELSPQGVDETTMIETVTGLFGILFLKEGDGSIKGFAKSIKGFSHFTKDLESIIVQVFRLLEKLTNWIATKYFGVPSFKFFSEEIPGMEKWLDEVHVVMKSNMEGKLTRTVRNAEYVMSLEKRGQEFMGAAKSYDKAMRIRERIRPVLTTVTSLRMQFEAAGIYGKSSRQMPVFIMLHGKSQIGKSEMIRPMIARLLARTMPYKREQLEEDFESLVYNYNPDSNFMDGFTDHVVMMIDEYSVVHPSKTTAENIQTMMIKCKNSFPLMLNMAKAELKGNCYFRGKYMVATSNVEDMYADAAKNVNCPIALTNRIDFDCIVTVKKKFATEETKDLEPKERELDKSKIPKVLGGFYWGLHEYILVTHTFISKQHKIYESKPIEIDELLDRMEACFKKYEAKANQDSVALKYSIQKGLEEAGVLKNKGVEAGRVKRLTAPTFEKFTNENVEVVEEDGSKITEYFSAEESEEEIEEIFMDSNGLEPQMRCHSDFDLVHFCASVTEDPHIFQKMLEAYSKQFSFDRTKFVEEAVEEIVVYYVDPQVREFLVMLTPRKKYFVQQMIIHIPQVADYLAINTVTELSALWVMLQTLEEANVECDPTHAVGGLGAELFEFFVSAANLMRRTLRVCSAKILGDDAPFAALIRNCSNWGRAFGTVFIFIMTAKFIGWFFEGVWWILGKIYSWMFGVASSEEVTKVELSDKLKQETEKVNLPYAKIPELHVGAGLKAQSHECNDLEAQRLGNSVLMKNFFRIAFGGIKRGNGLFLKGNIFLTNAHFLDMILARTQPGHLITLESPDGKEKISATREEVFQNAFVVKDRDIMVFAMPKCPRQFPDITKKFVLDEVIKYRAQGECLFGRCMDGVTSLIPTNFKTCDNNVYSGAWNRKRKIEVSKGFSYGLMTIDGDCGSPLFINDVGVPGSKIFGVHAAGHNGGKFGVCSALTQELVCDLVKKIETGLKPQGLWDYDFQTMQVLDEGISIQGFWDYQFETMKIVKEDVRPLPGSNSRSSIIKSKLYGAWGPAKKKPAKLTNGEDKNGVFHEVLLEALKEYDAPVPEVRTDFVEVCIIAAMKDITDAQIHHEEMKVVPLRVVLEGKIGTLYEPIPKDTSGGWPSNATPRPGWKGKTRFLGKEEIEFHLVEFDPRFPEEFGFCVIVEAPDWKMLYDMIVELLQCVERKERPLVVYTGCLKDELRKISKVDNYETRYFAGSPVAYLIVFKMFFGSYFVLMMKNKIVAESCVGINPYSSDWDLLARELLRFPFQFAGDFRKFDKRQLFIILWIIGVVIRSMYHDNYDYIREALWYELVHSRHLIGDKILEWYHSLPSGHFFTLVVNCIYVSVMFRCIWLLAHDGNISALETFRQHMVVKNFGDDCLNGIDEYAADLFDRKPIPELMLVFGMEFTAENKEEAFTHRRKLEDCTFLKRGFRYEPLVGRYVAPLQLDSILEMAYWTKRSGSERIMMDNVQNTLCELSLHPNEVYNEWLGKISAGISKRLGFTPVTYPRWVVLDLTVGSIVPSLAGKMRLNLKNMNSKIIDTQPTTRSVPVKVTLDEPVDHLADKPSNKFTSEDIAKVDLSAQGADSTSDVTNAGEGSQAFKTSTDSQDQKETGFHMDDTGITKVAKVNFSEVSGEWTSSGDVGVDQNDMQKYLEKPAVLGKYTWAAQVAGTHIAVIDLPSALLAIPHINKKVSGFLNIRGTITIQVLVNGNPFQSGRLLCHYLPMAQINAYFPGMRNRSLISMTQQPRVELDVNCDSTVSMDLPHVGPFPYYSIFDQSGPWGRFYVTVYAPLATGSSGTTTNEVTVQAFFKRVDLVTPTYLTAQGRDKQEQESKALAKGTVSGALSTVSKVAGSLSKVPGLSGMATPVSWATGILSGAAAAFGFSKPFNETGTSKISPMIGQHMANCDGDDTSQQLGTFVTNRVKMCPSLGGGDVDEANLLHICQIPAYFGDVTWNVTDVSDAQLFAINIVPSNFRTKNNYLTTHDWVDCVPMTYMHYFFAFWRGSIRIRLKFVSTALHSGKVLLIYAPGGTGATGVANSGYCMREVLDLRTKTEWEFLLPYSANVPYQEVPHPTAGAVGTNGILTCLVMNPLVCPVSVSQSVQILLEASAGPDFELANPRQAVGWAPFCDDAWLVAQGADDGPTNDCIVEADVGFGGANISTGGVDIASLCIGEKITSIYQLLKRFTPCKVDGSAAPRSVSSQTTYDIRPFTLNFLLDTDGTVPILPRYPSLDYYNYFVPMFAFSRGGVRIKCMRYEAQADPAPWFATQYYSTATTTGADSVTGSGDQLAPMVHNNFAHGQGIEVAVPQYTRGLARVNRPSFNAGPEPCDFYGSNNRVAVGSTDSSDKIIYRAVADDFQVGFFIGVPALNIA